MESVRDFLSQKGKPPMSEKGQAKIGLLESLYALHGAMPESIQEIVPLTAEDERRVTGWMRAQIEGPKPKEYREWKQKKEQGF